MKKQWIKDLKPGTEVDDLFVLSRKQSREYNGQTYLKLELADRSGSVEAVVWENVEKLSSSAEEGDVVELQGQTILYRDKPEVKVLTFKKAGEEKFNLEDFLPSAEKSGDVLFREYQNIAYSLQNPHLVAMFERIFADKVFVEKLKIAPGGKAWHHAYLGGLLEHTLKVTYICEKASELYKKEIDKDLLIASALLHDIGKVYQYSVSTVFDFTDSGRLLGHIVEADRLITEKIKELPDFPEWLTLKLRHLILSHQGSLENGSPVPPQILEGFILYYADEMDAKIGAIQQITKDQKKPDRKWSDYVQLINRYIYFGEEIKEKGK